MKAVQPCAWQRRKLGELFKLKHGYAFKGKFFSNEGDYVLLTPGNFNADGGFKFDKTKYYIGDFPDEFILRIGELLIVMTDLKQDAPILGAPAFIPENDRFLHNQRLGRVVDLDEEAIDYAFLYYLLNYSGVRDQIKATATGSTVRHTAPDRIYAVEAAVPQVPTQRKIASILSAYDDLIENNLRRIRILEEMAQNLYREWFVKFRFPGHENARFVDGIPEGWAVMKVPDAIWINPRMSVVKDTEKHFVAMNGLSVDSMLISNVQTKIGNSGAKYMNSDTLFARITPCLENGKTGLVSFLPTDDDIGLGSTEFIVLRSKTLCPEYVYLLARSDGFRDNAIKSMTGASGRQRVQNACFDKYPIIHPDQDTIKEFSKLVKSQFRLVFLLAEKIENARRTRDLLLPRLISGELDVSELDINIPEEIL